MMTQHYLPPSPGVSGISRKHGVPQPDEILPARVEFSVACPRPAVRAGVAEAVSVFTKSFGNVLLMSVGDECGLALVSPDQSRASRTFSPARRRRCL